MWLEHRSRQLSRTPDFGRSFEGQFVRQGGGSYPVASRLGDIFTNFLGGETQRTDLGGKRGRGTDLTSSGEEVAVSSMSATNFHPSC